MNSVNDQILRKICSLSKSDYGYLLKSTGKTVSTIACYGKICGNEKDFIALNKLIVRKREPTLSEIYKSKPYVLIIKETGYNSLYKEKLLDQGNSSYYILLYSKGKSKNSKILHAKIATLLIELKNELKKNNNEKKSLAFLSNPFEEINSPFLITDLSQNYISANKNFCQLINISAKEVTFDFFRKAKFFDSKNTLIKFEDLPFVKAAKLKSDLKNIIVKYSPGDSHDKWFSINSFLMNQETNGNPLVASLFVDITKEANQQQSIAEAVNSTNSVLFSTDADGSEYIFISDIVRNLFGYSPEEICKNHFLIIRSIAEEHFQLFNDFITKLRSGESATVEYKIKNRFGKEYWIRHVGMPIKRGGNIVRIVGMFNDITEEKTTRLMLENSEEKFRMLIDTADDLIFVLDGFGYFNMVNKNGASVLGFTPDDMIGKHFLEFIDKEDESQIADVFSKILRSSGVTSFETVFVDKFGKGITFEIHAKPLISDGEVSGMIGICRNITNRKLDEQKIRDLNAKLIEANRIISIERERVRQKINVLEELSKLKNEFISNISHELRTPLASIVGFAETIASDTDLPQETMREFSDIILNEGKRLAKLINDVLDFSKLESGEEELKLENLSLLKILENVVANFEDQIKSKELSLSKDYPKEDLILEADRERLSQVFYNLISNAIKFTQHGGRITIMVRDYGKEAEIAVIDTGIGIPERELQKLFTRFSKIYRPRATVTGSGFGLASVKQIIDLHKGAIRVNSEENKGSTFIVRLPKQQLKRG